MTIRVTAKEAARLAQKAGGTPKRTKASKDTPKPAEVRRSVPSTARIVVWVAALPPTVNHLYINNGNGGKVLGDGARLFRQLVAVACQFGGYTSAPDGDLVLTVRLTFPDKRRSDLDNRLKACQDALALALGFDDARIARLTVERAGYDKGRPACEMVLEVLE